MGSDAMQVSRILAPVSALNFLVGSAAALRQAPAPPEDSEGSPVTLWNLIPWAEGRGAEVPTSASSKLGSLGASSQGGRWISSTGGSSARCASAPSLKRSTCASRRPSRRRRSTTQPFWCENDLIGKRTAYKTGTTLDKALIAHLKAPRKKATALFEEAGDMDASEVSRLLASKESWLLSMDKSFALEISFLTGMVGSGGADILQSQILQAMPDGSFAIAGFTPSGALQNMSALSTSRLHGFCTKSAQGQLQACRELLECLVQGRAPNVEKAISAGGFPQLFISHMANFIKHTEPKSKLKPVVDLIGKAALAAKYDSLKSTGQLRKLTLRDLEPLQLYAWLLTKAQRAEVEKMTDDLLKSVGTKNVALKHKQPEASSSSTATRAKRAKKAAADADVDNLFA